MKILNREKNRTDSPTDASLQLRARYAEMCVGELVKLFDDELLKKQPADDFLDQSQFRWIKQLEANCAAVEYETQRLLSAVEKVPAFGDIQELQRPLSGNGWRVLPFLVYGHQIDWSHQQFPATSSMISQIPDCMTAMFSILQPGQRLFPHTGPSSAVLRYHLATFVPQPSKCGIRVANQSRHWEQGKSLVLNDYREHEAWNHSDQPRVVLFIDFKRPVPKSLVVLRDVVIERFAADSFSHEIVQNFNDWIDVHGDHAEFKSRMEASTLSE